MGIGKSAGRQRIVKQNAGSRDQASGLGNRAWILAGGLWLVASTPLALAQAPDAPIAPSGEQLLNEELQRTPDPATPPDGPLQVRRAMPVNPAEDAPPPANPDFDLPRTPQGEIVAPRAEPVTRPSTQAAPGVPPANVPPAYPAAEPLPAPSAVPAPAIPAPVTPAPAETVPAPGAPEATPTTPSAEPAAPRAEPVTSSSGPGATALALADGFYAREMFLEALTKYAEYLKLYPSDPGRQTALYRAGEAALRLNRPREARIFYATLLREFKTGPFVGPAAYRQADMYFNEENFSFSADLFRIAADNLDQPSLALTSRYYEARSLEKSGRKRDAVNAYQKVAQAEGENPYKEIALLSLAKLQVELGDKQVALESFERLIQSASKAEIRSEATVQAGLLAAELGNTDKAVEFLNRAIEDSAQARWKPEAVALLMRVLSNGEKFPEVIESYKKYGESITVGDRPEIMLLTATAYRRTNDFDTATRMYLQIFENYPNSRQASEAEYQYLLGLYQAKEDGLANRVDKFLQRNPTGPQADRAALLKAEFLFSKGQYKEAAVAYQRVTDSSLSPDIKAEGIYRQAWCYWEVKDMTQAVLKFNQFIGNYPKHPLVVKALAQRALAYTQNRQFDLALGDFDRIIRQYPDAAAERELALQKKALIQGQLGKNEEMVATFNQLLKEYPQTAFAPQAYWWIGQGAYQMRDYRTSVDAMRKARELDAKQYEERASIYAMLGLFNLEDIEALSQEVSAYSSKERQLRVPDEVVIWMGQKYFELKQFDKAAEFLGLAVESPTFDVASSVALQLGLARYEAGKYKDAIVAFDKYLETHTSQGERARTLMEKGRAQIALQEYDSALKTVEEAMSLQPEGRINGEGRLLLGDLEVARKDFLAAAKAYYGVAVLYDDPEITPTALKKAAEAYEKAGDAAKAKELRSELIKRYPDHVQ